MLQILATFQELRQKEYHKLIVNVPAEQLPLVFMACHEVGLVGEAGVQLALASLDFHGTNFSYGGGGDGHFTFDNVVDQTNHLREQSQKEQQQRRELPDNLIHKKYAHTAPPL